MRWSLLARTAIRSAADMLDVGCPDPALVLARIPSTRICWATSPTKSSAGSAPVSTLPVTAIGCPSDEPLNLNHAATGPRRAAGYWLRCDGVQSPLWRAPIAQPG